MKDTLFSKAFAATEDQVLEDTPSSSVAGSSATEPSSTQTSATEVSTTEASTTAAEPTSTTAADPNPNILEIAYTLDGNNWQILGTVDRTDWNSAAFDLTSVASSTWDDLSKIQISIRSLSTSLDAAPTIYLDAMQLEVEYAVKEPQPTVATTTRFTALTSGKVLDLSLATSSESGSKEVLMISAKDHNPAEISVFPGAGGLAIATSSLAASSSVSFLLDRFGPGDYIVVASRDAGCQTLALVDCRAATGYFDEASFKVQEVPGEIASTTIKAASFEIDKAKYAPTDLIHIKNAPHGSLIAIYYLDNPDTAPDPSYVYAAAIGDDLSVTLEAAGLPPGRFALVNSTDPAACGNVYLDECRLQPSYLGETTIEITPQPR